jgi:hydrogenase maturation protein HypF
LFDTAAALAGFTREISFEGQAGMWLEHKARRSSLVEPYPFPFVDGELDFRPPLQYMIQDRVRGRDAREIARAFHRGVAVGLHDALIQICQFHSINTIVLSGGVFQNELLMEELKSLFAGGAARDLYKPWGATQ